MSVVSSVFHLSLIIMLYMHYYSHFYNEKWVGEKVGYMNIICFSFSFS
jgi:hypothetical protein